MRCVRVMRGVRASLHIHHSLAAFGVPIAIGVTTAKVFCGSIGAKASRCEYAMVGDAVNTSARLMCAVNNGRGILVDERTMIDVTKSTTRHNVEFVPRGRLKLKGKDKYTRVFTPAFFVRTPIDAVHKLLAMRPAVES